MPPPRKPRQKVISYPEDAYGGCLLHPYTNVRWAPAEDFDAYLRLSHWASARYAPVVFVWHDVFKENRTFAVRVDDMVELVKTTNPLSPGVIGGRWAFCKFRDLYTIRLLEVFKE